MFDNARKYVLENILKSYKEYFRYQKEDGIYGEHELTRRGIQCAIALYHLREHLPQTENRSKLEALCPDYKLLGDIVNVSKHDHINKNSPLISHANQITEVITVRQYQDENGEYSAIQIEVIVKLDNGTERRLSEILFNVYEMWRIKLNALGIVNIPVSEKITWDQNMSREQAKSCKGGAISITHGEDYKFAYQLFNYDYTKGMLVPKDLTGAKAMMRIYKPVDEITINIGNQEFGLDIQYQIPLSEEQKVEYNSLDDTEKEKYGISIIKNSKQIQDEIEDLIVKALEEKHLNNVEKEQ